MPRNQVLIKAWPTTAWQQEWANGGSIELFVVLEFEKKKAWQNDLKSTLDFFAILAKQG